MPEVLANVLNLLPRARLFEQGASWILPPAQQDKEKLRQAIVRLMGNGQWAMGSRLDVGLFLRVVWRAAGVSRDLPGLLPGR